MERIAWQYNILIYIQYGGYRKVADRMDDGRHIVIRRKFYPGADIIAGHGHISAFGRLIAVRFKQCRSACTKRTVGKQLQRTDPEEVIADIRRISIVQEFCELLNRRKFTLFIDSYGKFPAVCHL